jgi:seryl-tRNA synthetase
MIRIPLEPAVPAELAQELAQRIYYVSDTITGFCLVSSDGQITAVDVTGPVDQVDLTRKLNLVTANDLTALRYAEPKLVWRAEAEPVRDVYDELVARGAAVESGAGQITVGEPVLSLMDRLDALLRALVSEEFGAREFRYATLIPTEALRRTGYFESFPHMVMAVSRLHGDVDSYRDFLDALADGGDLSQELRARCGSFDHCLPPTMCFHTYHQFADAALPTPTLVVTARGKSFRHESRYRRSLERLWDFTIREIVFLGTPEFVLGARRRLMERVYELLGALGLGGRCEVAGDPFFLSAATAARSWSQRLLELKYELRLPLDDERDVSVGSFNYHEQFFGRSFRISGETGEPVFTGCAGFGLERFAYAFLCQHGIDPGDWPAAVRTAVAM